jgi:hypothetical protein
MTLSIPKLSLVVLIGLSGSGKSTFAAKHFLPTEVLSSDAAKRLPPSREYRPCLHFIHLPRHASGQHAGSSPPGEADRATVVTFQVHASRSVP